MRKANLSNALVQIHRLFGEGTLAGLSDAQLMDRHAFQGDELAFQALVQRHGPMVLAVCRGVLHDANDADDAFQAVFLLLARKARSLWINESLGGWLHRVSCRIALQMKSDTARRRQQERKAVELAGEIRPQPIPWDDTPTVVHEEIDRLPRRYREPIVLCYLEHMTYQQAALHLCWSESTTQGRLARARNLLRTRLARRGVTLAGAAFAAVAAPQGASAVSVVLFEAALRSARQFGLGQAAGAGAVSTVANTLVSQAVRSMVIAKLTNIGVAALAIGTLTAIVATSLPARGRTIKDEPAAGPPPVVDNRPALRRSLDSTVATSLPATGRTIKDQPAAGPPPVVANQPALRGSLDSTGARAKARSTPNLLPGFRGADFEPGGRQRWYALHASPSAISAAINAPRPEPAVNLTKDLRPGRRLNRGDSLFSALGGFRLIMQEDGDLALYDMNDVPRVDDISAVLSHRPEIMKLYTNLIWTAGTNVARAGAGAGAYCVMHGDGNFVVYDEAGQVCRESGTRGYPGSFLRCQDDGNVVIYTPDLTPIWSSGTDARRPVADEPTSLENTASREDVP
jgi:RNA polymerase sigma factor (sigma-70 family)